MRMPPVWIRGLDVESVAIAGVVIFLAAERAVTGVLFVARTGEYGLAVALTLLSIGCSRVLVSMRGNRQAGAT